MVSFFKYCFKGIFIFCLFAPIQINGQQRPYQGQLVDQNTLQGIAQATIFFNNGETAKTNKQGTFQIPVQTKNLKIISILKDLPSNKVIKQTYGVTKRLQDFSRIEAKPIRKGYLYKIIKVTDIEGKTINQAEIMFSGLSRELNEKEPFVTSRDITLDGSLEIKPFGFDYPITIDRKDNIKECKMKGGWLISPKLEISIIVPLRQNPVEYKFKDREGRKIHNVEFEVKISPAKPEEQRIIQNGVFSTRLALNKNSLVFLKMGKVAFFDQASKTFIIDMEEKDHLSVLEDALTKRIKDLAKKSTKNIALQLEIDSLKSLTNDFLFAVKQIKEKNGKDSVSQKNELLKKYNEYQKKLMSIKQRFNQKIDTANQTFSEILKDIIKYDGLKIEPKRTSKLDIKDTRSLKQLREDLKNAQQAKAKAQNEKAKTERINLSLLLVLLLFVIVTISVYFYRQKKESEKAKLRTQIIETLLDELNHRIGNNISKLIGKIDTLLDKPSNDTDDPLMQIKTYASGVLDIQNQLRWSSFSADEEKISPAKFWVKLNEMAETLFQLYFGRNLTVEYSIDLPKDLNVNPDALNLVGYVFNELMTNICKYAFRDLVEQIEQEVKDEQTKPVLLYQPEVKIIIEVEKKHISLKIIENGVGMHPELFDEKGNYNNYSGSVSKGLGIIYRLSKINGGNFIIKTHQVHPKTNKGSVFTYKIKVRR